MTKEYCLTRIYEELARIAKALEESNRLCIEAYTDCQMPLGEGDEDHEND